MFFHFKILIVLPLVFWLKNSKIYKTIQKTVVLYIKEFLSKFLRDFFKLMAGVEFSHFLITARGPVLNFLEGHFYLKKFLWKWILFLRWEVQEGTWKWLVLEVSLLFRYLRVLYKKYVCTMNVNRDFYRAYTSISRVFTKKQVVLFYTSWFVRV